MTGAEVPDSSTTEQMSLVPQLDSQALLDSNVALHASTSNVQAVGSSFSNIDSSQWKHPLKDRLRNLPTQDQIDRFQSVILVLASFGGKLAGLSSQLKDASVDLSCTFQWKSLLHFKWLAPEKKCSLTSLHASVPYGYSCHSKVNTRSLNASHICPHHVLHEEGRRRRRDPLRLQSPHLWRAAGHCHVHH